MRPFLLALCAAMLAVTPAWATATLSCDAALKTLDFSIMGIVPDGQGSPLLQVRGEVNAYPEGLNPAPDPILLTDENRTQYWLDEHSLNLLFYVESGTSTPFTSAELRITTQVRAEEPAYFDGTFHFESYAAPVERTDQPVNIANDGKVTCSIG